MAIQLIADLNQILVEKKQFSSARLVPVVYFGWNSNKAQ